jgi:hypothetical protein
MCYIIAKKLTTIESKYSLNFIFLFTCNFLKNKLFIRHFALQDVQGGISEARRTGC